WGVSDEIRVLVILRGPSLARRRKIDPEAACTRACPVAQHGFESARDQIRDGRTNDSIALVLVLINKMAFRVDDRLDRIRRRLLALGRKNLVGRREFEQRGLVSANR